MKSKECVRILKGVSDRHKFSTTVDPKCYMAEEAIDFAIEAVGKVECLKETIGMMKVGNEQDVLRLQEVEEENKALRKQVEGLPSCDACKQAVAKAMHKRMKGE